MTFSIAHTIDEALAALADGARPIAGGSDLVVGARHGKAALPERLVAVDRIAEMRNVEQHGDDCVIGAAVTHAELMIHPLIVEQYTALADASALVGSPATRNVGTLGGNIMNASPAMDTGAPLFVMGASVELRSADETRRVAITDLWAGPGETVARDDELCTSIRIPARDGRAGSAYVRLEYRRAMEIAVVGAAAVVELNDDDTLADVSVALTAVAPTIIGVDVELDALTGRLVDPALLDTIAQAASTSARPISDLRASDEYRRHTVGVMARRAVDAAARRAEGESIAVPVNQALGIGA